MICHMTNDNMICLDNHKACDVIEVITDSSITYNDYLWVDIYVFRQLKFLTKYKCFTLYQYLHVNAMHTCLKFICTLVTVVTSNPDLST